MKRIFTILVTVDDIQRLDSILNRLRISLNDRDRSKVFNINNAELVNYTIFCEETTFNAIVEYIHGTRVY